MMNLLGRIFGSGDVISKGIDLIDDIHTSKEEEILAKNEAKVSLLRAYAPFRLAQRWLAILFSTVFLICFMVSLGLTLAGKGNPEEIKLVMSEFYIGEIMLSIILFYFGGGAFEGIIGKAKSDKSR